MMFLASLIEPNVGLTFWTLVSFALVWLLLGKPIFRTISNGLKSRENSIQEALDAAEMARREKENLQAENEAVAAEMQEERMRIMKEANDTKNAIIAKAKEDAKVEAKKIVENAMREAENQKKAAMVEVKNQAGNMALEIAEKVIRKDLKGNASQESFVNDLVSQIKLN